MNKQELVRENDRILDQAERRGKEGQDLLKPPYNTDWDQGQVRRAISREWDQAFIRYHGWKKETVKQIRKEKLIGAMAASVR